VCIFLFAAMGLLFIAGFGLAPGGRAGFLRRLKPQHLTPGFNEVVFLVFAVFSFTNQLFVAPNYMGSPAEHAAQATLCFFLPGQNALQNALETCSLDGGRIFASGTAWLLAIIFLASAVWRVGLAAGTIPNGGVGRA